MMPATREPAIVEASPTSSVERAAVTPSPESTEASPAGRQGTVGKLMRQRVTVVASAIIVVFLLAAVLAPWIAPHGELETDFSATLQGPSSDHWLGTDQLGRDTLSRTLFGARVALESVVKALLLAIASGVTIGVLLGYVGGRLDRYAMRLVDVLYSIPGLVIALAVIAILGPSLTNAMIAVGIIFATYYVRLARGATLAVREELYIDAARVSGTPFVALLRRHVLPNIASPLVIQTAIIAGQIILIEAALSFLGLGRDIERASWGGMLATALENQYVQPFLAVPPGVAIVVTVLAFNLFGDGLRDALGRDVGRHHLTRRSHVPVTYLDATPTAAAPTVLSSMSDVSMSGRDERAPAGDARFPVVFGIRDLEVAFANPHGGISSVVREVSLDLERGRTLALVGESGSGKTMTALAAIDLLPAGATLVSGTVTWSESTEKPVRGRDLAMVFQEPMTALNPAFTIGQQIAAPARRHLGLSRRAARERAVDLLARVGVPDPGRRVDDYPHQFSGGMAQRAMIAMALVCEPSVLIADEPTTALDVTVQGQIVDLLLDLQDEMGMAMLFVTHDLGLVADVAHRVAVMYAGQIVEEADASALFARPAHPYTEALLDAMPARSLAGRALPTIPGRVPAPWGRPSGCVFAERCRYTVDACRLETVELVPVGDGRRSRCVRVASIFEDVTL
ncbi:dipeptide/oligopeptide/nickel ABC transporter permease/ATP-binding protein [Desertimonas flava]|uniref:dipeptide/oligopeptide/nickel ABC transporter permease/ATP-binding protein n=1 Tax=Desertimonas flava TaxID=2064846 RepID=UPI000E3481F1|nr:dipeptide/oligopeptide/nickel ABC transporter permease/ATP-binding protein [Desertimonas flava]